MQQHIDLITRERRILTDEQYKRREKIDKIMTRISTGCMFVMVGMIFGYYGWIILTHVN